MIPGNRMGRIAVRRLSLLILLMGAVLFWNLTPVAFAATPITFGQTLTGAIAGTETDFYTFYANAGDKVIIRMKDTSTSGYLDPFISLYYDPYGYWVAGDVILSCNRKAINI